MSSPFLRIAWRTSPLKAAGSRDQPFAVFPKKCPVDSRFVIVSIQERSRGESDQVFVADLILCKKDLVIPQAVASVLVIVAEIKLAADNRLDSLLLSLGVKFRDAVEVTVVRDGDGRHPHFLAARDQRVDPCRSIEQRILGVTMKMTELGHTGIQGR